MSSMRYTKDHEYIELDGETATVGITSYAQEQLGDIVFVELPEIGKSFKKGDEIAVVESVKAASEIYAPVSGTVTQVNNTLEGDPGVVNSDPLGGGWLLRMKVDDPAEFEGLMDEAAYTDHIA